MKHYSQDDFQNLSLQNVVIHASGTAPSSPVDGSLWYDTGVHALKWYDSTLPGWRTFGATGAGGPPSGPAGGDLTGNYPNPDIAAGVVGSTEIANGAVLLTKIQQLNATRLIGNFTGAAAAPMEVSLGADLSFSGSALQLGAFTGDITKAAGSLATSIGSGKVTSTHILDGTILLGDLSTALIENGVSGGVALQSAAALRRLGYTAHDAMPGNSDLGVQSQNVPLTANIDANGFFLTNLPDPTGSGNASVAATKGYVDNVAQGLDVKASVKLATTANITLSGNVSIDGTLTQVGDRILVKNQTDSRTNGIYVVAAGAWTRAPDMDNWSEVPGAFTFVEQGTLYADTGWVCTSDAGGTIGTNNILWSQFSGAGSYTAGNGLQLTGTDFSVNVTDGIEIVGDALQIKDGGVTSAKILDGTIAGGDLADGSVDLAGTKVTGTLPIAKGGTQATTAAGARTNLGIAGKALIANPALTANTWSGNLNHALAMAVNSPQVQFYEVSSGENVMLDWKVIDANNIQIRAGIAVAANALNVVVQG